jgi:hypothetical protein
MSQSPTAHPPPSPPVDNDDFGPTWVLFRPLKSDIPASIRFRSMLKTALRAYKLKCEGIRGTPPAEAKE